MVDSLTSRKDTASISKTSIASDLESAETINKKWMLMIADELKGISRIASQVKSIIDQKKSHVIFGKI